MGNSSNKTVTTSRVTGLAAPTVGSDAVNKTYADALVGGAFGTSLTGPANLSGTYVGPVVVTGNATITGNVTVQGDLLVTGTLSRTGSFTLTVNGDLRVGSQLSFLTAAATADAAVTVLGDAYLGKGSATYTTGAKQLIGDASTSQFTIRGYYPFLLGTGPGSTATFGGTPNNGVASAISTMVYSSFPSNILTAVNGVALNAATTNGSNVFTITGDFTAYIQAGDQISVTSPFSDTETVLSATFSSPNTTVTTNSFVGGSLNGTNQPFTVNQANITTWFLSTALGSNQGNAIGKTAAISQPQATTAAIRPSTTPATITIYGDLETYGLDLSAQTTGSLLGGNSLYVGGNVYNQIADNISSTNYYRPILTRGRMGGNSGSVTVNGTVVNCDIFTYATLDSAIFTSGGVGGNVDVGSMQSVASPIGNSGFTQVAGAIYTSGASGHGTGGGGAAGSVTFHNMSSAYLIYAKGGDGGNTGTVAGAGGSILGGGSLSTTANHNGNNTYHPYDDTFVLVKDQNNYPLSILTTGGVIQPTATGTGGAGGSVIIRGDLFAASLQVNGGASNSGGGAAGAVSIDGNLSCGIDHANFGFYNFLDLSGGVGSSQTTQGAMGILTIGGDVAGNPYLQQKGAGFGIVTTIAGSANFYGMSVQVTGGASPSSPATIYVGGRFVARGGGLSVQGYNVTSGAGGYSPTVQLLGGGDLSSFSSTPGTTSTGNGGNCGTLTLNGDFSIGAISGVGGTGLSTSTQGSGLIISQPFGSLTTNSININGATSSGSGAGGAGGSITVQGNLVIKSGGPINNFGGGSATGASAAGGNITVGGNLSMDKNNTASLINASGGTISGAATTAAAGAGGALSIGGSLTSYSVNTNGGARASATGSGTAGKGGNITVAGPCSVFSISSNGGANFASAVAGSAGLVSFLGGSVVQSAISTVDGSTGTTAATTAGIILHGGNYLGAVSGTVRAGNFITSTGTVAASLKFISIAGWTTIRNGAAATNTGAVAGNIFYFTDGTGVWQKATSAVA
jgi:hypothetical protein